MRLSIVSILVIMMACGGVPKAHELAGEYVIEYEFGRETLVLKETGTYEQRFVASDGKTLRNSGRWEMSGRELLLRDAMVVDDGFGNYGDPSKRMGWHLVPERWGGTIVIPVNPDRKERYEKQR